VQTAAVNGAKVIPMGELQARVQELDPDEHILVMCHHGVRSLKVTSWLREQGYQKVQSVRGGIDAWARKVDPKVPTY
jgi:rhodanese-related sulfurtransferase